VNTWKVILATIVIWSAGVMTGGFLVHYSNLSRVERPRSQRLDGPPPWLVQGREFARRGERELQSSFDQLRGEFLLHATRELNLTADQHERIEKVIRDSQDVSRKMWEQVAPEMRKALDETKQKVLAELTPEQQGRFEQLLKQQQRPPLDGRQRGPRRGSPPREGSPREGKSPSPASNAPPPNP
jgi:hypothetical protein